MTASFWCALVVAALWLKMASTAIIQGTARMRANSFARPEDALAYGKGSGETNDAPLAVLGQNVYRNDVENIPMFSILLALATYLGGSATLIAAHGCIFLFARVLHTVFYLRPTQPARTAVFGLGMSASLSLAGFVIYLGAS